MSAPLETRPEARTFKISELVQLAQVGRLRVPRFQRPIRWKLEHNLALLDSVIAGYPVGSLLLWQRSALAERISFGSVVIEASERNDALFVVDGQQRLTALVATLRHPDPVRAPPGDPYALFYDLEAEKVVPKPAHPLPPTWAPLRELADPRHAWLTGQPWSAARPDLVDRGLTVSVALRDTQIPAYVVHAASDAPLRVIFKRLNTSGVAMRDDEVFDALHGQGDSPLGTVRGVRESLAAAGFGELDEQTVLKALFALRSVDPKRRTADELEALKAPMELTQTARALELVFSFLREDAGVRSVALLPYRGPLTALARFFHFFPRPHPRSRRLLRRWFWRGCLTGRFSNTSNPAIRRQLVSVMPDREHESVQALVRTVPNDRVVPLLDGRWRYDSAVAKVVTLGLMGLRPLERDGSPVDLSAVMRNGPKGANLLVPDGPAAAWNRVLLSDPPSLGEWGDLPPLVAESHAVDGAALAAASRGDSEGFLGARRAALEALIARFGEEHAEWAENDRPPLVALLEAG